MKVEILIENDNTDEIVFQENYKVKEETNGAE